MSDILLPVRKNRNSKKIFNAAFWVKELLTRHPLYDFRCGFRGFLGRLGRTRCLPVLGGWLGMCYAAKGRRGFIEARKTEVARWCQCRHIDVYSSYIYIYLYIHGFFTCILSWYIYIPGKPYNHFFLVIMGKSRNNKFFWTTTSFTRKDQKKWSFRDLILYYWVDWGRACGSNSLQGSNLILVVVVVFEEVKI